MRVSSRRLAAVCLIAGVVFAVGCGAEGEPVYQVSGTVTFQGKPVPKGLIYFDPDQTKETGGDMGFASILDGKFNTAEEGQGIRGGAYEVRVNGFDGKVANDAPFGQALFLEYRTTADLPMQDSTYNLDVPKNP
jgi:hypothetical protein